MEKLGPTTRRQFLKATAALLALPLLGCARAANVNEPPAIRYGEDICVRCGMIISDPAFASAYRTTDGEVRLFDDLGEMVIHHRERREPVAVFFVHDYHTREWLLANQAQYVVSRNLRTPMGFGVAALRSETDARALAEQFDGEVMGFDHLLERAELKPQMKHQGH